MRPITRVGSVALSLALAVAIDWLAPWPFVMSPLYGLVTVLAALVMSPGEVVAVAAVCFLANLLSLLIQHPPESISIIYSLSNVIVGGMAVLVSMQRQQVLRHAQEAETARQQLQQFLSMVSHDIRNPTTAIIGYTHLLQRHVSNGRVERVAAGLTDIDHAAQRIRRLTSDLVDAAVVSAGHFDIQPEPADLIAILAEVVALQQATTSRHTLTLDAPDHLTGQWDPQRIEQVFANLVGNAIKYSPEGCPVQVRAWQEGNTAVVAVSDQGIGIAPEMQARLFTPYVREVQDPAIKGAGLGLAIARGIVEKHGGQIWLESALQQGSTFYVRLPLAADLSLAS